MSFFQRLYSQDCTDIQYDHYVICTMIKSYIKSSDRLHESRVALFIYVLDREPMARPASVMTVRLYVFVFSNDMTDAQSST